MGTQIEVVAENVGDFRAWDGWVHSRLRQLVLKVQYMVTVRPWPPSVKAPPSEDGLQRAYYYMGLKKRPVSSPCLCCTAFCKLAAWARNQSSAVACYWLCLPWR